MHHVSCLVYTLTLHARAHAGMSCVQVRTRRHAASEASRRKVAGRFCSKMASIDASSSRGCLVQVARAIGIPIQANASSEAWLSIEFNKIWVRCCVQNAHLRLCALGWGAGPSPNPCTGANCTGAHCMPCLLRGRIPPPGWHRRPPRRWSISGYPACPWDGPAGLCPVPRASADWEPQTCTFACRTGAKKTQRLSVRLVGHCTCSLLRGRVCA